MGTPLVCVLLNVPTNVPVRLLRAMSLRHRLHLTPFQYPLTAHRPHAARGYEDSIVYG
jgi:hypothetical protein